MRELREGMRPWYPRGRSPSAGDPGAFRGGPPAGTIVSGPSRTPMPNELFHRVFAISVCLALAQAPLAAAGEDWRPAPSKLWTPWAAEVSPERVHPEHPRPTLVREEWISLNGLWEYAVTARDPDGRAARPPERFEGRILVPFPIEAPLSGVGRRVSPREHLWYRRAVEAPAGWRSGRILLHFGAVDWEAEVFVDGERLGGHRGGYDAFSFDVTDRLRAPGAHDLAVRVWDPTDEGSQPRGKQVLEPRGIWYEPSTGIWQTVWLERVPEAYVRSLRIVPSLARAEVRIRAEVAGGPGTGGDGGRELRVRLRVPSVRLGERAEPLDGLAAWGRPGEELAIRVRDPKPWSPSEPWLYDLEAALEAPEADGTVRAIDAVRSYFGIRDVAIAPDASGIARIALNGPFLFELGLLDQGFWPDGLYTAPADEALRFDVELAKRFGFVMARKHVKVEPERWYAWCDRLGLLVWQDMPSGGGHAPWPRDGAEISRSEDSAAQYRRELEALVRGRGNHPSIVAWVLFNEGWGQFDARGAVALARGLDPTRLAIAASGGNDVGAGDARDIHVYPGPAAPPADRRRASVLGEFGALGLPVEGHLHTELRAGARRRRDPEALLADYVALLGALRPLVESRLSAAVYTQTSDLEREFNGLVTYDRRVVKLDPARASAAAIALGAPLPPPSPSALARAATVAWWRFDRGGEDASGQGNHLSREEDGAFVTSGRPRPSGPIEGFFFGEWTVEAAFRIEEAGRFHAIVGKDGRPTASPLAPLQLKVRGDDGRIQIEAIDESGIAREVRSRDVAKPGVDYRVSAASDGRVLRLYVDRGDGAGYELEGRAPFEGALVRSWGTWSVGRGWFDGRAADRARAAIAEVRIAAVALPPPSFLFAPPDGPARTPRSP